uniref:Uncharacterized protein n=1 Tax=virus sp. ctML55 TaxID=2827627 RepID=A0A8S5RIW7_9VIRU|nr:MAG TPA: hypothetical protein [virus sp. ctML55]
MFIRSFNTPITASLLLVSKLILLFNISDNKDCHAYIREVISKVCGSG